MDSRLSPHDGCVRGRRLRPPVGSAVSSGNSHFRRLHAPIESCQRQHILSYPQVENEGDPEIHPTHRCGVAILEWFPV